MGKDFFVRFANRFLRYFGLSIVSKQSLLMTYQHDYGAGSYESYKNTQIFHNKRKLDEIWADEETIKVIATYIQEQIDAVHGGICHGTRRGYEQQAFSDILGCPVLGTEISDTAEQFPNTIQWDFHDQKDEWLENFSFVYSNSLDQAFDPCKAVDAWIAQLDGNGLLFIEHTMAHSTSGASEMDPFGAHPMVMPYLLFKWARGSYDLVDILELSNERKKDIWIFVVRPRKSE